MRVLVTGGAGFIGSHLVDRLLEEDHEVTVLDNLSTGRLDNIKNHLKGERIVFVKGDIRDHNATRECLSGVDCLVHLAAITSVPFSIKNPEETLSVNFDGTENLLRASVENNVRRVMFASSSAVYGEPDYVPIDEDHPWRPISPYGVSKQEATKLCEEYRKSKQLDTTAFQFFNVYGPRQDSSYAGVISQFINQILSGQPPVIFGDGNQTRDFVYVKDVVDILVGALDAEFTESIYNVGSGKATTINELLVTLSKVIVSKPKNPIHRPPRAGDIRRSQADISKVKQELGYSPRVDLETGLHRFVTEKSELSKASPTALAL